MSKVYTEACLCVFFSIVVAGSVSEDFLYLLINDIFQYLIWIYGDVLLLGSVVLFEVRNDLNYFLIFIFEDLFSLFSINGLKDLV